MALDKGEFVGREALARAAQSPPERALRTLVVGGEDYLALYGGEAVRRDGADRRPGAQLRLRPHRAPQHRLAYLPAATAAGAELEVEVLGEPVAAQVAADVLYDPGHERVRG